MALPVTSLLFGIRILITGDDHKSVFAIGNDQLPGLRVFEVLGEALPQVILTVTYVANNYDYVHTYDRIFDTQTVPTSIVSIVFSIGTIVVGIVCGYKARNELIYDY